MIFTPRNLGCARIKGILGLKLWPATPDWGTSRSGQTSRAPVQTRRGMLASDEEEVGGTRTQIENTIKPISYPSLPSPSPGSHVAPQLIQVPDLKMGL